jgi:aerobic carbon-monoxide dehydrogenase medium subunit
MIPFTYLEPRNIDEALDLLARHGEEAKLIAGGTGLVNLMKQRLVHPAYLIGLRQISHICGVRYFDNTLSIDAFCTHRDMETFSLVREKVPVIAETFEQVANIRIRSVATVGGAIAHADPNQDPLPTLLALDARVLLRSLRGDREVAIHDFFTGYYETVMESDELLTSVIIPPQPEGSGAAFLKFLPQTHDDYATVAVAAWVRVDGSRITDARVALGAVATTPIRATAVEDALRGAMPISPILRDAAALVADAVDPTTDFRGSAAYKRDMAFVQRAVTRAVARARKG